MSAAASTPTPAHKRLTRRPVTTPSTAITPTAALIIREEAGDLFATPTSVSVSVPTTSLAAPAPTTASGSALTPAPSARKASGVEATSAATPARSQQLSAQRKPSRCSSQIFQSLGPFGISFEGYEGIISSKNAGCMIQINDSEEYGRIPQSLHRVYPTLCLNTESGV